MCDVPPCCSSVLTCCVQGPSHQSPQRWDPTEYGRHIGARAGQAVIGRMAGLLWEAPRRGHVPDAEAGGALGPGVNGNLGSWHRNPVYKEQR